MNDAATASSFPFRWRYIAFPTAILLLSLVLTAFFYPHLPFPVAYRFQSDGSPDRWAIPGLFVFWTLFIQSLLTLVAAAIALGTNWLAARFIEPGGAWISPQKIIMVMSNMVLLPQSILFFAMLDIFSYNSYQIHLLPLWVFTLIVLLVGGIILGIFFLRTVWQFWTASKE